MPVLPFDDLDVFLDDFALTATVRLQSGGYRQVRGIFDDPYLNAQIGEYEHDTSKPRLLCKESDVVGVLRGDIVDMDGRVFDVLTSAQPDGNGMAVLELAPRND